MPGLTVTAHDHYLVIQDPHRPKEDSGSPAVPNLVPARPVRSGQDHVPPV
jgi:hypothetical protein